MKHLRTFEKFDGEGKIPVMNYLLEEDQVDELNDLFESFVEQMEIDRREKISHKELQDIFSVDERNEISDDFVRFLDYLSENTTWFNYKGDLPDKVKNDVAVIIAKLGVNYDDEDDDFEFAEDDPNWPYEEEEGDFAKMDGDEEENDDINQLRQRSEERYKKEDDLERRKEEIFNKLADGKPLTDDEKDFINKMENKKILNFRRYNS